MDKHFTITINDDHGMHQLNLHQFVKKILLYLAILFAFVGIVGAGTIWYLSSTLNELEAKKVKLENDFTLLNAKNDELHQKVLLSKHYLAEKQKELKDLSLSLKEIENLIGITPVPEASLKQRVNLTKLSSEQIAVLLTFIPNGFPLEFKGVTGKFGNRIHPITHKKEYHPGIDLRAKMNTPIYATADGIVEWASMHKKSGYGKLIIINHNYGFKTYFGHLNRIVVRSGTFISKGTLIGYSGNTGLSSGPHLHYEVRFMGRVVNPYWFMKWNVKNFKDIFKKEKKIPWQSLITEISKIKLSIVETQIQPSSQLGQK